MRERTKIVVAVVVLALAVGLPTIRGGFVGGDDHRLVLNHALVNHPSLDHAVKLFTTTHRDLYQPVPLLTFQIEFAVAQALDLFSGGVQRGAWLFHLDNAILHAVNAVLVFLLILRLHERAGASEGRGVSATAEAGGDLTPPGFVEMGEIARAQARGSGTNGNGGERGRSCTRVSLMVAATAAVLFAVHPFQMEVIAWVNGRMMLLSTLFALASLLVFMRWLERPRVSLLALTFLFVVLCGLSKVRVSLPVLFLIAALARRVRLDRRFWGVLLAVGLITAAFVLINVKSTAEAKLFAEGAEHLRGPRLVRVLMALAFYFRHVVWPAGLCSYYPTPPVVSWSDAGLLWDALTVMAALAVLGWTAWKTAVGRYGTAWFFSALAVTLPFFPARNILAADRYMYLPIIGLFWIAADRLVAFYRGTLATRPVWVRGALTGIPSTAAVVAMIGTGWYVGSFYENPIRKTYRIATLFPDTPRVWEPLGWSLLDEGRYDEAIECARMELRHRDAPKVLCGGYQLWGIAEIRRGHVERGLSLLKKAIEVDPQNPRAKYRLAKAYDELGRVREALPYYEAAAKLTPLHNPTLNRLARAYRVLGKLDRAREVYEQVLENSKGYDVTAITALAEMDIAEGTPKRLREAVELLTGLLAWMPENLDARTNLGVAYGLLGDLERAAKEYRDVLRRRPDHAVAAVNLAKLYEASGRVDEAAAMFDQAAASPDLTVDHAVVVHDFYAGRGEWDEARAMWNRMVRRFPQSPRVKAFMLWSAVSGGASAEQSAGLAQALGPPDHPLAQAARVLLGLRTGEGASLMERLGSLAGTAPAYVDARRRLLGALQRFDKSHPDVPWTLCLAAELLRMDGRTDVARLFAGRCGARCRDDACRTVVSSLEARLADRASP